MDNTLTLLWSVTALLSPLLLFLASCYYLSKSAKADSILLFIGSGIGLVVSAFFRWMPQFIQSRYMPSSEAENYYAMAGIISFIGGICFVIGFVILINNAVNTHKQKTFN
jgi:zinc transporter ZupT